MNVSFEELKTAFERVLIKLGFSKPKADLCSRIFAENSRDGVYSHGLSRFPTFVQVVKDGAVNIGAEPECIVAAGVIEYWDGHRAPGMYAATKAMERAIEIAKQHGMGAVSLKNSNHWMRGGTYGLLAAEANCIGICATNAIGTMLAWGGHHKNKLGNNPMVFSFPRKDGPVVLDMALSQYSYGKMNEYRMKGQQLPFDGGYTDDGVLTKDPSTILNNRRPMPIGLWKGSGLSLIVDLLTSALSGGNSVGNITATGVESGCSQFFLAIDATHLDNAVVEEIIAYTKQEEENVLYPGENMLATRTKNLANGIPVNEEIWNQVLAM